jgi:hypothetical protein
MADVQSNIKVSIDTTEALAQLKNLQRQISAFHTSMAKTGAAGSAVSANMQQNLLNQINAGGRYQAQMVKINSTSEAFNSALAKNQFSMKEYFRYAGAATTTFGKLFAQEHATINKVARENVKTLQTQYIKMGRDANGALRAMSVRPLTLDMQNLQTQTAMAAQKQALLNQLLRQGSTNLLNFGKNTQWAGRQLMVGFTVPLMYFGSVAGKTFMQLEEQAIRFKRVYGDMFTTSASAEKALKDVQLLANSFTKYGVAVADTMKMAADVAATGKMGADLLAQVDQATRLAVLGGIDQQKSLDTIISLTSTFGIASKDLADNINFLNSVENQTILNIDDLTTAIPKAAPVVKQLGGDVKDLAFFMTAMREGGIDAAQGANAIKSGLASIINPSKAAREMLKGFGIDVVGLVNADKGNVKKMVVDLATALDGLDPLNRAQAIEKMFGKFQFARISTLFQNVIKDGSQAQTVLGLTKATTEELAILSERELSKISESPMYKFKKQVQDLKVAIAPIGGEFLKALTPVLKFFGDIFKNFNGLGDGTKKFIVLLTTLLAGIGPLVLMSFGLLANGLANIIKLFVGIKSLFNGVGKSSAGLGEQTNFLTQEQMRNAAAAASLDQAHQKLQQRFTSEAEAVTLLTAAYRQALVAQRAFGMPGPGMAGRRPPMKLATGIVSVPGPKGAGDVVPAMLSPGEAVISAPIVNKYPQFVGALATGNIEGHETGRIGSGSEGRIGKSITTVMRPYGMNVANSGGLVGFGSINPRNAADMTSIYTKQILQASGVSTKAVITEIKRWETANRVAIDKATAAVNAGANATTTFAPLMEKFTVDMKAAEGPMSKFTQTAQSMLPALQKDLIQAQEEAKRLGLNMKSAADVSTLAKRLPNNMVAQSMATPGSFGSLSRIRAAASAQMGGAAGISQYGIPRFMLTPGIHPSAPAYKAATSQEHFSTTQKQADAARTAQAKRQGRKDEEAYTQGRKSVKTQDPYEQSRKRNSPHVLAGKDGADDARAYSTARNSQLATATMPPGSQARNRVALYGTGPMDADAKSVRRQLEAVAKRQLIESKKQLALDEKISQSKQKLYGTTGAITSDMRIEKRLRESQNRALMIAEKQRIQAEKQAAQALEKQTVMQKVSSAKQNAMSSLRESAIRKVILSEEELALAETKAAKTANMRSAATSRLGGAAMGLSMVAMMGSMAPGKIGEISQKLMMPLMALSMIVPMLNSAFGLLVVGIGVLIASYVMNRMAVDKAGDAAIDFADKIHASNSALTEFGKFAKNVTASEIMNKRRSDNVKQYQTVTGKTTFGESYVGSESGKSLIKSVGQNLAASGSTAASNDLTRQLSMAISSGALSTAQARSVALNIGDQLGNQALGIQVNAKLVELMGPNGENLLKDPLTIRSKMIDATNRDIQSSNNAAKQTFGYTGKDSFNIGKNVAGGAVAGATVGLIASQALAAVTLGVGEVLAPAIIGAFAAGGALIGGVAGYFNGRKDRGKRIAASTGADAAIQKIALEDQQQMLDGLEVEYQKKIDIAKASGDIAEAEKLGRDFLDDKQKLLEKQQTTTKMIVDNFKGVDKGIQEAYMNSADKLMTKKYKGTALEDVVPLAKTQIDTSKGTKEQKYLLKMEVASGNIDPIALINMLKLSAEDKTAFDTQMKIITKFGGKTASEVQNIADLFIGADGKIDTKVAKDFELNVSKATTTAEAQKIIDFNNQVAMSGGELDIAYLIKYYQENSTAAEKAQELFDAIKLNSGNLSIDVITKFLPPEYLGAVNKEYYDKLTANQKQVYMNEIVTIMSIQDETTFKGDPDVQKWLGESTSLGGGEAWKNASFPVQKQMYAQHLAGIKTEAMDASEPIPPSKPGGGGSGPSASPLDEIIKKLRDLRQLQIGLTTGWAASWKAMDKYFSYNKKTGQAEMSKSLLSKNGEFMGLAPQLRKKGASEAAIDFITGLSPEDYKKQQGKLFKIQKDGSIKLLAEGKKLNLALQAIAVGNFANSQDKVIKNVNEQSKGFTKLIALGYNSEQAYKALSDAEFANAIAGGKMKDSDIKAAMAKQILADKLQIQLDRQKALNGYLEGAKTAFENEQAYSKLALKLREMGYSAEDIASILGNENLAKGFIDSLANGALTAERIKKALLDIKNTEVQKTVTNINSGNMAAAFQPGYDAANKLFDIKSRMLDMEWRGTLKQDQANIDSAQAEVQAEQDLIDAKEETIKTQEKEIKKAQDQVDAANKLIETQNTRNEKLSHDLKLMDHAAEAINAKYDKQKTALDEIANINATIAGQQQKQLTLADALTQGDISAAAKTAQEMRAQNAADAIANQSKGLDKARELELSRLVNDEGKTRLQIEAEQYAISETIYSIQQNQLKTAQDKLDAENLILTKLQESLVPLQDELDKRNKSLKAAQDKLDADNKALATAKENITVLGKTKQEWDDWKLKVDAYQLANDKLINAQLAGAMATATLVEGTWTEITNKLAAYFAKDGSTITIKEIHEIYEVIMGSTGGSGGGGGGGSTNPGNIDAVNTQVASDQAKLLDAIKNGTTTDVSPSSIANDMATALLADKAATKALGGVSGVLSSARYTGQGLQYAAKLAAEAKAQAEADALAAAAAATKALMSGGGADAAYDRRTGYSRYAMGGMVGNYLASGGFGMKAVGTDIVPAMLTPGEFVVTKYGVQNFGVNNLRSINAGTKTSDDNSVYTYNLNVNVKSDANPDEIARTVIAQIRQIDNQKVRGNKL